MKIAFAPECSRTLATSMGEKSGRIGTATAPIKVIEKKAIPQFGMFRLRIATLSPGTIPFFSRNAISAVNLLVYCFISLWFFPYK